MSLINKFKNKKSGYSNLFPNHCQEICNLLTDIHAAKISSGTELENIIQNSEGINLIKEVDVFFDNIDSFNDGIYLINKKYLKYSNLSKIIKNKLFKNILVDFIIVKINNYKKHCYIIELKSGSNFDTKKAPAERNNLLNYETQLSKIIQATTSIHICSFFEEDKNQIQKGLKNIFDKNEILTGTELCELLNISHSSVLEKNKKDQEENLKYFLSITKKYI